MIKKSPDLQSANMDELKWLEDNCFLDTEKEFYDQDNMWKKLDLLTPPLSPQHESSISDVALTETDIDMDKLIETCLSDLQTGDLNSHVPECSGAVDNEQGGCCRCSFTCRLKDMRSNLVQDCMWSGTGALSNAINTQVSMAKNKTSPQTHTPEYYKTPTITTNTITMEAVSPQCVDPTAVFSTVTGPLVHIYEPDTPPESGEDDDVDIETIELEPSTKAVNQKTHLTLPSYRSASKTVIRQDSMEEDNTNTIVTSPLAHVTSMHNYSSTQPNPCVMSPTNHMNPSYATKRSRTDYKESKKGRFVHNAWDSSGCQYGPFSKSNHFNGSRHSSDSEDSLSEGSKRAQHNVLERKRRNDLKSSFIRLRGEIPELQTQERAAKVVILKKAAEYIYRLQRSDKQLNAELHEQKKKQERLKCYLDSLQGDHFDYDLF